MNRLEILLKRLRTAKYNLYEYLENTYDRDIIEKLQVDFDKIEDVENYFEDFFKEINLI